MSYISTDPIADMLARIRNAVAVGKTEVQIPHSKAKEAVSRLLQDSGFISNIKVSDDAIGKTLSLTLVSGEKAAQITEIVRLSKPGRRQYAGANEIPVVKRGRGVVIVSTSKGMMTGDEAKKQGVGGELICRVY